MAFRFLYRRIRLSVPDKPRKDDSRFSVPGRVAAGMI